MTQWSKNKVLPSQINGGNEYTANDDLSVEAVNAIVNNSFYAAESSASAIGIIDLESQSGTLSETDYDNAVNNGYFLRYGNTLFINSSSNEFYVWFYNPMVSNSTISSEYNRQNQKYIKVTKSNRYYTYTTSDFVEFYTKIQSDSGFIKKYSTMPIAGQDYLGDIAHYIGTTNSTYTNGYFYECVENNGVYSWVQKDVQPAPPAITVDSALSTSSENPVQNKVITNDLNTRALDTSVVHKTGNEDIYGLKAFDTRPKVGIEQELPSAYSRLDYIQSTNGQYISTGYSSYSIGKAKLKLSFDNVTDEQWLLGYQTNVGGATFRAGWDIFAMLQSGEIKYAISRYAAGTDLHVVSSGITAVVDQIYEIETQIKESNQYIKIDGTTLATSTVNMDDAGTVTAYLFRINGSSGDSKLGKIKLYECKLYDSNDNLIRNYVPCKRISDSVAGLYDFVSETFYPSATTSFVGGSEVTPSDDSLVMLKGDVEANPTLDGTESNLNSINIKGTNFKIPQSPVSSVNGQTGAVVLDADDINDSSTTNKFVTASEKSQITTNATNITSLQTSKQDTLVSGVTLKTINNQSLLGAGNIDVSGGGGGSGITNYEVIDRENSLPTATATSPDFVQYNGKLYRKQINGGVPSIITDLTGTSWVFNNVVDELDNRLPSDISFVSNNVNYVNFYIDYDGVTGRIYYIINNPFTEIRVYDNGWVSNSYKIISITGGTDATNSDLIAWLQANATMQPTTTYEYVQVIDNSSIEGLPLGFIFSSALPQSNQNYHLLNGDSLAIADYGDFYTLLTTLVGQSWNLTCSANEYAEDIAKTGNCGKFVINSTSSDVTGTYTDASSVTTTITVSANSFKLPTITRFIQGLSSLSNLGESIEAGLPNITGEIYARDGGGYWGFVTNNSGATQNGAFYTTADGGYSQRVSTGTSGASGNTKFSAQKSNAIYGNSATVQPQATYYPYYMVVKNNNVSGVMNYLQELAQAGVQSLGGAVGDITLGDGLEIINGELKLTSQIKEKVLTYTLTEPEIFSYLPYNFDFANYDYEIETFMYIKANSGSQNIGFFNNVSNPTWIGWNNTIVSKNNNYVTNTQSSGISQGTVNYHSINVANNVVDLFYGPNVVGSGGIIKSTIKLSANGTNLICEYIGTGLSKTAQTSNISGFSKVDLSSNNLTIDGFVTYNGENSGTASTDAGSKITIWRIKK